MRKSGLLKLVLTFILLAIHTQAWAMSSPPKYEVSQHKSIENVEIIEDFNAPKLNRKKDIWIYLPPDYETTNKSYPVLYMHNGQALFNDKGDSWQLTSTVNNLIKEEKTDGVIIVGVEADNPQEEFAPWKYSTGTEYIKNYKGDKYADFIVNKVKPYIDNNYRTLNDREHTGIMGKDLGGLISLYMGIKYQHVFSKVGTISPALWVYYYGEKFKSFKIGKAKEMKIYLLTGKEEIDNRAWNAVMRHDIKKFYSLLEKKDFEQINFVLEDEKREEDLLARRFTKIFLWLYED